MDRISSLPESLIVHILEGLPLIDRVRTSKLSTKWRFLWTCLPSLVLDSQFYSSICKAKNRPLPNYVCIINGIVLQSLGHVQILLLYVPSNLDTYNVWLMDRVVNRFLRDGVELLSLEKDSTSSYHVPSSVFTSVKSSTVCLSHLELRNYEFLPPLSFQGFPTLISLELSRCQATADAISRLVSGCPMLQKLVLQDVDFYNQNLVIDVPWLRHLSVHGKFKWLFLKNVNNVEVLTIDMEVLPDAREGLPALISNFFDDMVKLEEITLGGGFCEILASHSGSLKLARYDGLKCLAFVRLHTADLLEYVLNSIKCFPKLTELTVTLVDGAGGEASVKDENKNYDLEHLLRVDFQNILGTTFWMKLIEQLLHCSPVLKLMSVKFDSRVSPDKMLDYVRDMMNFCRTSTAAKVDISKCTYVPRKMQCRWCGRSQ